MLNRVRLTGLRPNEYSHPLDQEARRSLESITGLKSLVRKANEVGLDQLLRLESMANKIRVTERQFPRLFTLFRETQTVLNIHTHVDLYVQQSFSFNAFAAGVQHPHVTVTTELVNHFSDPELQFIFAHELGHVQSEHLLYHQIGVFLPRIVQLIGSATLGLGHLLGTGIEIALYDWIRKSEFTADRAGLLGTQDVEVAKAAFSKLAGVPAEWFESLDMSEIQKQADDFEQLAKRDTANKFFSYFGQMWRTHPWIIIRFRDLLDWYERGYYTRILSRRGDVVPRNGSGRTCSCGEIVPEDSLYCSFCGALLNL